MQYQSAALASSDGTAADVQQQVVKTLHQVASLGLPKSFDDRADAPLFVMASAPGLQSAEVKQLHSLLSSILRLASAHAMDAHASVIACWGVSKMAGSVIRLSMAAQHAASSATASLALPSLVFGRCCIAWAQQLQQESVRLLQLVAAPCSFSDSLVAVPTGTLIFNVRLADPPSDNSGEATPPAAASAAASQQEQGSLWSKCNNFLGCEPVSQQLTAVGYDVGSVVKQLQQLDAT